MSARAAARAARLGAPRRDVLIVEDDPVRRPALRRRGDAPARRGRSRPTIADGRVVYLSTFSKTRGARVSRRVDCRAAGAGRRALEIAKQSADLCTGALDQRLVYEIWRRGMLRSPRCRCCELCTSRSGPRWSRRCGGSLAALRHAGRRPRAGSSSGRRSATAIDTDALLRASRRARRRLRARQRLFRRCAGQRPARGCRSPRRRRERIEEGIARLARRCARRLDGSGRRPISGGETGSRSSAAARAASECRLRRSRTRGDQRRRAFAMSASPRPAPGAVRCRRTRAAAHASSPLGSAISPAGVAVGSAVTPAAAASRR